MTHDLPGSEFRALIHPHTGDQTNIRNAAHGLGADIAVLAEGEHGLFFVKAVPNRAGGRRESLIREGLINPYVVPLSPAVQWQAQDDTWVALGFEAIDARAADLGPASQDLPAVIDALNQIAAIPLPEIAQDWLETRWDRFATGEADTKHFRGNSLLYTDIQPHNLLVSDEGVRAVDWGWPTRGAAFIDPACLVVQLIAAGHSPESAESWAARCTPWAGADPNAVDAFAAANLRMYRRFAERRPAETWLKAMATASQEWAAHRGITVMG
ncbi:protein kinase [Spirillospora sp. CA-294931]|uniref:protein kinase n=1 Tax=Spirillospora sp. CA-294931 TaxID=3240042 RepID=UPI003D8C725C